MLGVAKKTMTQELKSDFILWALGKHCKFLNEGVLMGYLF